MQTAILIVVGNRRLIKTVIARTVFLKVRLFRFEIRQKLEYANGETELLRRLSFDYIH